MARFNTDQAVRVQVVGEQSYQLVKVDDKWSIDRPVPARADQDKVKSLLRDISNVSADKFINDAPTPQDLAGYGLDKPRLSVTVELAPPKPTTAPSTSPAAPATQPARGEVITIVFGKIADEKAFAKRASEPWVFQVAESKLKDLQPKLIDLRDKHVLEIAGKEISRVEVSPPAGAASTLEKADDAWQMRKPFAGPCDDEAVEKLTEALRELQASEFVDNPATFAAFGLDPPAGKIVLHFRGSDKTTTLMLGRKSESGQTGFVRDATGKSVAVVKSDDYETLSSAAAKYWTRTILELPADAEIVRVDLERQDGKSAVIRDDEGEYRLVRPAAGGPDKDVGPGDKENVEALMDALKSVKAEKILSLGPAAPPDLVKAKPLRALLPDRVPLPPPAPASQPTTASAPATMPATAPASQPATQPVRYKTHPGVALRVVQQDGKSCVWKEGAVPVAVGELAGDFHDKLAAEMRDRSILKIAADKAVSLKLDREKLSLEFLRSGEQWRYAGDSFFKVDAGKVKDFLAELGKIKAVRFADYREKPPLKQFALDKPAVRVAVKTEAGASILLSVSSTGPQGQTSRYAASSQVPGVFVLAQEDAAKLQKGLADFKKP